ncbi:MAG: thioredoxin family protein [Acidobacteria bacterium]|nr:MAG: thioredoxin family protein [Acidobacteriota bacterium]
MSTIQLVNARECSRFSLLLGLAVLTLVAGGCGGEQTTTVGTSETAAHHDDIAWFDGSPEAAFALAESEGKPLFLYWGAEWCPPCHYLKNKIFKRPEFVAKSQEFVPVYLDGDTESAQILGEELGVMGYPTVIIFSPDGEEVMRMPSTIPVEEYAVVLDSAMERMRPVKTVLAEVMEAGPANAHPSDLNVLAFYSWEQDSKVELEDEEKTATFGRLNEETPNELRLEKSRFLALYLGALIQQSRDSEEALLTDAERAELDTAVAALLEDDQLVANNLILLFYYSRETVELLHPADSPPRQALIGKWVAAAQGVENTGNLPVDDRLDAIYPQIQLAKLQAEAELPAESEEEVEIPAELQDHIRERIAWATGAVTDEGELQAVVNSMGGLLMSSGLEGEAEELLTQMMDKTEAPYYFMSWIGSIKKDADQPEEALAQSLRELPRSLLPLPLGLDLSAPGDRAGTRRRHGHRGRLDRDLVRAAGPRRRLCRRQLLAAGPTRGRLSDVERGRQP